MTRHEDVYYTCNGCGQRMDDEHTKLKVTNTDPAALKPVIRFHLCAKCWLDVYAIANRQEIERQRREDAEREQAYREDQLFRFQNPGFEG